MPRSNSRGGSNRGGGNHNPSGRNQYSGGGVMDLARERPFAAAAAAAGAAAAGLFLWSRRSQISNQLSNLSDQIGEWSEGQFQSDDDTGGLTTSRRSSNSGMGNRRGMSETGGGNASLGRTTGGGGVRSTASGRGRAAAVHTDEMS